ncbi:MAG: hypothetical protein BWY40_00678 [bacterium ADurb.Bin270]|nr:MAG: hypothetical protein BWY40_00678 [bacterium ADurb.Bin270]
MIKRISLPIFIIIACISIGDASAEGKNQHTISQETIELIAAGDLQGASVKLAESPHGMKVKYIQGEISKVLYMEASGKPSKSNAYNAYRRAATAYHNLYLFLLAEGISSDKFLSEAKKNYTKASRVAKGMQKDQCKLLEAALFAASGDLKKASKIFEKVEQAATLGDFAAAEHAAAYNAALGNVDEAVRNLQRAYEIDPEKTSEWIFVSDDFFKIQNEPSFLEMLRKFAIEPKNETTLSIPASKKPALEIAEPSPFFMKGINLPKYKRTKRKK